MHIIKGHCNDIFMVDPCKRFQHASQQTLKLRLHYPRHNGEVLDFAILLCPILNALLQNLDIHTTT